MVNRLTVAKLFSPLTWSVLGVVLMLVVGGFIIFSTRQVATPQDIRQQASEGNTQITISLQPDKTTLAHDQTVSVDVLLNTNGNSVSAISLTGTVQGPTTDVTISATGETGLTTAYQHQTKQNDATTWQVITFASPTAGHYYSTHGQTVKLTTLTINPSAKGTITISVAAAQSAVTGQAAGTTIQYPGAVTLTINDPQPTPTPGPPDQGIHRSCNEYCADTRECGSGLTCYYNQCRNPRNIYNAQCQLPPSPSPVPHTVVTKKTVPTAKIVSDTIATSPAPSISSILVDKTSKASPTPSPTTTPSPTPTPLSSPSPSPSVKPAQQSKGGSNAFLIAVLVTLLVGGIGGLAYVLLKYRG